MEREISTEKPEVYWLSEIIDWAKLAEIKEDLSPDKHSNGWLIIQQLFSHKINHSEQMDPRSKARLGALIATFSVRMLPDLTISEQEFYKQTAHEGSIDWEKHSKNANAKEIREDIEWIYSNFDLKTSP